MRLLWAIQRALRSKINAVHDYFWYSIENCSNKQSCKGTRQQTLISLSLQRGDVVECEIDEIGCISNTIQWSGLGWRVYTKKLVTPRNLQFIIKSFQAILIQGICKKIQQIDITSKDFTYFFKIRKTCNHNLGGIIVYILIKYKEYLIHWCD